MYLLVGHRGHLGGLATLKQLSGAPVYGHEWEADIIAGDFHPFTGPITDNEGNEVVADGETPDDGALLGMDYLVAGVIGSAEG